MKKIQKDVLSVLTQNPRLSDAEIAKVLNQKVADVHRAVQDLEDNGVILGYTTIVNEEKVENNPIRALVELKISPEKKTGYDAIARKIYQYPNVITHFLLSGDYDFLVIVEGRTHQEIAAFVFDKLATLENVTSTNTKFMFKKYKEHGVLLEKGAEGSRLAVSP